MLEFLNRYSHGFALIPSFDALRRAAVFDKLDPQESISISSLVTQHALNEGYFRAVLRECVAVGWVEFDSTDRVRLTPSYRDTDAIPKNIMSLFRFPAARYLQGKSPKSLAPWIDCIENRWGSTSEQLADFLDGVLILPLVLELSQNQRCQLTGPNKRRLILNVPSKVADEVARLITVKGWGERSASDITLNAAGAFIFERIFITAVTVSYRPMLLESKKLLFGVPNDVFVRNAQGHERHLDRRLNVLGSGFQHKKYFAAMRETLIEIFNADDLDSQPKYVADMGCGDGTLLKALYSTIETDTLRGRHLSTHPLTLIAADYNQKALEESAETLSLLPHILIQADIAEPERMLVDLANKGVNDPDDILHIRSFLDHDRPYRPPTVSAEVAQKEHIDYQGVYVDVKGGYIPPAEVAQSTVEHLRKWSSVVGRYGLLVLEVHCLEPKVAGRNSDVCESLHFDTIHTLSRQFLLTADEFLISAAQAGLFCIGNTPRLFPERQEFCRITLSQFAVEDFRVRVACENDYHALEQLNENQLLASYGSASDCSTTDVISSYFSSLRKHPKEHLIVYQDDAVIGFARAHPATAIEQSTLGFDLWGLPANDTLASRKLHRFLSVYQTMLSLLVDGSASTGSIDQCVTAPLDRDVPVLRHLADSLTMGVDQIDDSSTLPERILGNFGSEIAFAKLQLSSLLGDASMGVDSIESHIKLAVKYRRYLKVLLGHFVSKGWLQEHDGLYSLSRSYSQAGKIQDGETNRKIADFRQHFIESHPAFKGPLEFMLACLGRYDDILSGRVDVTDVLFEYGSSDVFSRVFKGDPISDYFNEAMANCLRETANYIHSQPRKGPVRVLEIGAGTGTTTGVLLDALDASNTSIEFEFTDISPTFLRQGEKKFGERFPWVSYSLLDIESEPQLQGLKPGSFDLICTSNVLHNTKDIVQALKHSRQLLAPNGVLVIGEFTSAKEYLLYAGALLSGYWRFEDDDRRLPGTCLLDLNKWKAAFELAGLQELATIVLPSEVHSKEHTQALFVCESVVTPKTAIPDAPTTTSAQPFSSRVSEMDSRHQNPYRVSVQELIRNMLGTQRVGKYASDTPIMSLGLDSLEVVELRGLLSKEFELELAPTFLFDFETEDALVVELNRRAPNYAKEAISPNTLGTDADNTVDDSVDDTTAPENDDRSPSAAEAQDDDRAIAIVGVACRLPGGCDNPDDFWTLLESGQSAVVEAPVDRFDWPLELDFQQKHKGLNRGAFLENIASFDAPFFKISPKEAELMDPQQRLLLELSWHALEDSGHSPTSYSGSKTGVYIGACHFDYRELLLEHPENAAAYLGTGNSASILANRLSHFYNVSGPSLTIDTACSSSLVAVSQAIEDIRAGRCDQALVGGINLICSTSNSLAYFDAKMLSPTGACHTFDQSADGYVRGEGGVVMVLKPLRDAVAQGDSIYGVLKGSAVNHCGLTASLTAPKPSAQADLVCQALEDARLSPSALSLVEAHGTGTPLGDPIEVAGLTYAFESYRDKSDSTQLNPSKCFIGSAKSNIGHLEGAAGIAGLLKVLLAFKHQKIPPTCHFKRLNTDIDMTSGLFSVADALIPWEVEAHGVEGKTPLRTAGVSSFGFGGANAHVVVQEYVSSVQGSGVSESEPGRDHVFVFSAKSEAALTDTVGQIRTWLETRWIGPSDATHSVSITVDQLVLQLSSELSALFSIDDQERISSLRDLSWEKLEAAQFAHFLSERYGLRYDLSWGMQCETVPELARLLINSEQGVFKSRAHTTNRPDTATTPTLSQVAFTLQTGRADLNARLAIVAGSVQDLLTAMAQAESGVASAAVYRSAQGGLPSVGSHANAVRTKDQEIAQSWVAGERIEWESCYWSMPEQRLNLPGYAYQRQSYWVPKSPTAESVVEHRSHPLLHQNSSTLQSQRFTSRFEQRDVFSHAHVLNGQHVLSATAIVEMVRAAVSMSTEASTTSTDVQLIKTLRWSRPVVIGNEGTVVHTYLWQRSDDELEFKLLIAERGSQESEAASGVVTTRASNAWLTPLNVQELDVKQRGTLWSATEVYQLLDRAGYDYGNAYQRIKNVSVLDNTIAVDLFPPDPTLDQGCVLDPGALDGALQAALLFALAETTDATGMFVPSHVDQMSVPTAECADAASALVKRIVVDARHKVVVDIDVFDATGVRIVGMRGLHFIQALGIKAAVDSVDLLGRQEVFVDHVSELTTASQPYASDRQRVLLVLPKSDNTTEHLLPGTEVFRLPVDLTEMTSEHFLKLSISLIDYLQAERQVLQALDSFVLVVPVQHDQQLLTGLVGVLSTFEVEHPGVKCLLIACHPEKSAVTSTREVLQHAASIESRTVRCTEKGLAIPLWRPLTPTAAISSHALWQSTGTYVIAGGAGGLGLVFTRHVLERNPAAKVLLLGRRALTEQNVHSRLGSSPEFVDRVDYQSVDIGDRKALERVIEQARARTGSIAGVINASAVVDDKLMCNLTTTDIRRVMYPKVIGTDNLDCVTAGDKLEFFVCFSSLVGELGNVGQANYTAANKYMDAFIHDRALKVTHGSRHGLSRTLLWPLWKDVDGLGVSGAAARQLARHLRVESLAPHHGIRGFELALAQQEASAIVIGTQLDAAQNRLNARAVYTSDASNASDAATTLKNIETPRDQKDPSVREPHQLSNVLIDYLISETSRILKFDRTLIDSRTEFGDYGFDSITLTELADSLSNVFGVNLVPTVFFEYKTIDQFSQYLVDQHAPAIQAALIDTADNGESDRPEVTNTGNEIHPRSAREQESASVGRADKMPIAIVGMTGSFPEAETYEEFAGLLTSETSAIGSVPKSRWDWQKIYGDPAQQENRSNVSKGGFLRSIAEFDSLFFNLSPAESERIDPQQRLLLNAVWQVVENAGYDAQQLRGSDTGLFVGTFNSGYDRLLSASGLAVEADSATGSVVCVGPNRASFFMDWHGPSEPVDTACSSSLVAIHRAVNAIRSGECGVAVAGGINTLVTPELHISFNRAGMLSADGLCRAFGDGANGYVRGEGVGLLMLKPLSAAERDGDHIHAVIRGSAINHGGRSNSLTAPNPIAQADLLRRAHENAQVDQSTIGYVEAHGTGTQLGDPIEIDGLKKVFVPTDSHNSNSPCFVGSVKSNIGHLEYAAGVAGVIKSVLQLQHGRIFKSLHCDVLNSYIDLSDSRLAIARSSSRWSPIEHPTLGSLPRRAGISSFGFSGANAHVVIEEYRPPSNSTKADSHIGPHAIVLSARSETALRRRASDLLNWLDRNELNARTLERLAYTLQVGRQAMDHRAGFLASGQTELREGLQTIASPESPSSAHVVTGSANAGSTNTVTSDSVLTPSLADVSRWVQGDGSNWYTQQSNPAPQRLPLPGYPFEQVACWGPTVGGESLVLGGAFNPRAQSVRDMPSINASSSEPISAPQPLPVALDARSLIVGALVDVLKLEQDEINPASNFSDYGVDSIAATRLIRAVNARAGLQLPTTVLFDYSSVDRLTAHLDSMLTDLPSAAVQSIVESAPASLSEPVADTTASGHRCVTLYRPGSIDEIQLRSTTLPELSPNDVCLDVRAFGLNFGDLLCVDGLYPTMPPYPFVPGFEASGVICAVGAEVTEHQVGDEVVVIAGEHLGAQSSRMHCPAYLVQPKPKELSFAEAASVPVIATTVTATFQKARLEAGDSVLIQAATSCVGAAAIQYARHIGAVVYATASSDDKVERLRDMGVEHVINYVEEDFRSRIMEMTEDEGVDVVINTLGGEAIENGLKCLAPGGRYIELAMTGMIANGAVDLSTMRSNLELHALDLRKLALDAPKHFRKVFGQAMDWVSARVLTPYLSHVFTMNEIGDAYEHLRNRARMGKVVVTNDPAHDSAALLSRQSSSIDTDVDVDIAVVGMSGRFPGSASLDEFWQHLASGDELIEEAWRWNVDSWRQQRTDSGKTFCTRGGFIDQIDQFDASFFGISGIEARYMDPQQRLFLEECWHALEHSGYCGESIEGSNCGVYVGCAAGDYQNLFDETAPAQSFWGNAVSVVASRIAYQLNLKGPAVAIDTACSSSLVAIHYACNDLLQGKADMALAGGVFVRCTDQFYLQSNRADMLSGTGRCYAFDERADGFVPGEGVGVLTLKRLSDAQRDGDTIHGVIRATVLNQDGVTNGITAPSARSQEELQNKLYDQFDISPKEIQLIEAHGTGTPLGDPIEFQALERVFEEHVDARQCALGSVKTNIGHLASAAGVAGVIKILLALKHRKMPPSINFANPNPAIDLDNSPFFVNTTLRPWEVDEQCVRTAAISSFGFSGTNAHAVISESPTYRIYEPSDAVSTVFLSARTSSELQAVAANLKEHLQTDSSINIGNLSYTLAVGRKHFGVRIACVVQDVSSLIDVLSGFLQDGSHPQLVTNDTPLTTVRPKLLEALGSVDFGDALERAVQYCQQLTLDLNAAYVHAKYSRLALPTYPFARSSYWITPDVPRKHDKVLPEPTPAVSDSIATDSVVSITGDEFFVSDHVANGQKVFPGVGYIDLAANALSGQIGVGASARAAQSLCSLRDVSWEKMLVIENGVDLVVSTNRGAEGQWSTHIRSSRLSGTENATTYFTANHAEVALSSNSASTLSDFRHKSYEHRLSKETLYQRLATAGLDYGPAHQVIQSLQVSSQSALAELKLPDHVGQTLTDHALHPALADGALQAALGFDVVVGVNCAQSMPIRVPVRATSFDLYRPCTTSMTVTVSRRDSSNSGPSIDTFDIGLWTAEGELCAWFGGLEAQAIPSIESKAIGNDVDLHEDTEGYLSLQPTWRVLEDQRLGTANVTESVLVISYGQSFVPDGGPGSTSMQKLVLEPDATVEQITQSLGRVGSLNTIYWFAPGVPSVALDSDDLIDYQRICSRACFRFAKALLALGAGDKPLTITSITQNALAVAGFDQISPAQAGTLGLLGSLSKEQPNWQVRRLDHDLDEPSAILDKPIPVENGYFALRGECWYEQTLSEHRLAASSHNETAPSWRAAGVYVIVGGSGGLGETLTQWLLCHYSAQVVWLGRRTLDETITTSLDRLETLGPRPAYYSVDAGDREELSRVVADIEARYGQINGVVHSAIVLEDASIQTMTETSLDRVMHSKVDVSVRIAQAFDLSKLDLFLVFSSLNAFAQMAGQGNYVAGCVFKDTFAAALAATGAGNVKVVNWGFWGDSGVVATEAYKQAMSTVGIGSIEGPEGMRFLESLIRTETRQLGFLKRDGKLAIDELKPQGNEGLLAVEHAERLELNHLLQAIPHQPAVLQQTEELIGGLFEDLEKSIAAVLFSALAEAGLTQGIRGSSQFWLKRLQVKSDYADWLTETFRQFKQRGWMLDEQNEWTVTAQASESTAAWNDWQQLAESNAHVIDYRCRELLCRSSLSVMVDVLQGRKRAVDVLFPEGSMDAVGAIYRDNKTADAFNSVVADVLEAYLVKEGRSKGRKLKILEVGAGTGGTSAFLFNRLDAFKDCIDDYRYTDLSVIFLQHAQSEYAHIAPYLSCAIVDIEKSLLDQDIALQEFDCIVASNVIHATRDIRQVLKHLKMALRTGGLLLMNEVSQRSLFTHATFGLLDGWWLSEDRHLRLPGSPLLSASSWRIALTQCGYDARVIPEHTASSLSQQIVVAQSDGTLFVPHELLCEQQFNANRVLTTEASNQVVADATVMSTEAVDHGVLETIAHATDEMADDSALLSLPKEQAVGELAQELRLLVSNVLGVTVEELERAGKRFEDSLLSEFGMDSLLAMKIKNGLYEKHAVEVAIEMLISEPVGMILEKLYEQILLANVRSDSTEEADEQSETFVF